MGLFNFSNGNQISVRPSPIYIKPLVLAISIFVGSCVNQPDCGELLAMDGFLENKEIDVYGPLKPKELELSLEKYAPWLELKGNYEKGDKLFRVDAPMFWETYVLVRNGCVIAQCCGVEY